MPKISDLDLNWPEVIFLLVLVILAVTWLSPDVLWTFADFIGAVADPIGRMLGSLNPFKE